MGSNRRSDGRRPEPLTLASVQNERADRDNQFAAMRLLSSRGEKMSQTYKYDQRLVAFLDILGFRQLVDSATNDVGRLATVVDAISYAKSLPDGCSPGRCQIKIA